MFSNFCHVLKSVTLNTLLHRNNTILTPPKYDTVFNYTQKTGGVDIKSAYHQKSNYKRHIQGEVSKKS